MILGRYNSIKVRLSTSEHFTRCFTSCTEKYQDKMKNILQSIHLLMMLLSTFVHRISYINRGSDLCLKQNFIKRRIKLALIGLIQSYVGIFSPLIDKSISQIIVNLQNICYKIYCYNDPNVTC